jgi:hypothetical protein
MASIITDAGKNIPLLTDGLTNPTFIIWKVVSLKAKELGSGAELILYVWLDNNSKLFELIANATIRRYI